jgi:predicted CoA-binding protein
MAGVAQSVAVLGASPKRDRYSNRAVRLLLEHGHRVIPVHPTHAEIEGLPVARRLGEITVPVDTVSVYVAPAVSSRLVAEVLALKPGRVIFNPGSENPPVREALERHGIRTLEACTLVLLHTNQF